MAIVTIGLDLAKTVFQVHGIDEHGKAVLRRQLRRGDVERFFRSQPPCVVGMEACGSAHHWARRLSALGHEVRLVAPTRVKAYVQRGKKNDANDAAAIAEAVTRPHMTFVPVKTEAQQGVLMLHRSRDLLVRQRTMLINALRAHLTEFGIIAAKGRGKVADLIAGLEDAEVPALALVALRQIAEQIGACDQRIEALEKEIVGWHKNDETSRNLATIPGIGPITASPPSPASGQSPPRRWRHRSPIPPPSMAAASWRHGWGWCHGRTRPAARIAWVPSPRPGTATCAACWSSAPPASCGMPATRPQARRTG